MVTTSLHLCFHFHFQSISSRTREKKRKQLNNSWSPGPRSFLATLLFPVATGHFPDRSLLMRSSNKCSHILKPNQRLTLELRPGVIAVLGPPDDCLSSCFWIRVLDIGVKQNQIQIQVVDTDITTVSETRNGRHNDILTGLYDTPMELYEHEHKAGAAQRPPAILGQ